MIAIARLAALMGLILALGGGSACTTLILSELSAAEALECDRPGEVALAGEIILRVHAPAGGMDCQERADVIQRRIVDALSIGLVYPKDIHVQKVKSEWAVFVKDIMIITADKRSAEINSTTPKGLAEVWAKNLRRTIPESTPQKPPSS